MRCCSAGKSWSRSPSSRVMATVTRASSSDGSNSTARGTTSATIAGAPQETVQPFQRPLEPLLFPVAPPYGFPIGATPILMRGVTPWAAASQAPAGTVVWPTLRTASKKIRGRPSRDSRGPTVCILSSY
jgi:hypothetical protein